MNVTGTYTLLNLVINSLFLLSNLLVATFHLSPSPTPNFFQFLYSFMIGGSYCSMLTITMISLISAVPHDLQAIVTSASYAFRATGSTLGVTFASAVFQNVLRQKLQEGLGGKGREAEDVIRWVEGSIEEIEKIKEAWMKKVVVDSYMSGLNGVFWLMVGFAATAWICGCFIQKHVLHSTLNREEGTGTNAGSVRNESNQEDQA